MSIKETNPLIDRGLHTDLWVENCQAIGVELDQKRPQFLSEQFLIVKIQYERAALEQETDTQGYHIGARIGR